MVSPSGRMEKRASPSPSMRIGVSRSAELCPASCFPLRGKSPVRTLGNRGRPPSAARRQGLSSSVGALHEAPAVSRRRPVAPTIGRRNPRAPRSAEHCSAKRTQDDAGQCPALRVCRWRAQHTDEGTDNPSVICLAGDRQMTPPLVQGRWTGRRGRRPLRGGTGRRRGTAGDQRSPLRCHLERAKRVERSFPQRRAMPGEPRAGRRRPMVGATGAKRRATIKVAPTGLTER